jgi:hypothetical protein
VYVSDGTVLLLHAHGLTLDEQIRTRERALAVLRDALLNEALFAGALSTPLIQLALTAHGNCLGQTRVGSGRPIITLHPSLWGGTERTNPWGLDASLLGPRYACDVLIHECLHVSVEGRVGRGRGSTSHNCDGWVAEVTRVAPMLGLAGVVAARSLTKRVGSRTFKTTDGTIPFKAVATFPYGARKARGELAYYRLRDPLPFETS